MSSNSWAYKGPKRFVSIWLHWFLQNFRDLYHKDPGVPFGQVTSMVWGLGFPAWWHWPSIESIETCMSLNPHDYLAFFWLALRTLTFWVSI